MRAQDEYYSRIGITHPSYACLRVAGRHIRKNASEFFHGRLIDIGCGTKSKKNLVGEFVEDYKGLDHTDCPHGQTNIDLLGTAYDIPAESNSFDCALCTAVLEHLEEPKRALKETYRILRPGGYALYTIPFFWHLHEEPRDFYRYTRFGIQYLFEDVGFEIIKLKPLSGFWLTFGTELNYYISGGSRGPLRFLTRSLLPLSNLIFIVLDKIDRRVNKGAEKWTWMYMVVARKPNEPYT